MRVDSALPFSAMKVTMPPGRTSPLYVTFPEIWPVPPRPQPASTTSAAARLHWPIDVRQLPMTLPPPHHQSVPRVSPPLGVQAAHQVVPEMACDRKRTLPSPRPTFIPDVCGEEARVGSQL